MRTYKWMAAIVLLLGMTSCGTYYRMVSQVNSDGSMHRECGTRRRCLRCRQGCFQSYFFVCIDTKVWK